MLCNILFPNNGMAMRIFLIHFIATRSTKEIFIFKQGRSYEIRNPTERVTQCYNRSLPLVAPPRCIPEFATLITRGYKISTWRVVQHPFDLTYSFTSDTCEPVNIRQKGEQDISK